MQIAERSAGNVTVLDLSGQITFTQGDQQFKDKINSLVHQGHKNILVNMANVTHVDSAGLGELVGAYTTVTKAGGSMKLVNLTKKLHDLLTITKLLTVFDTFESEQDALKQVHLAFRSPYRRHERSHVIVLGRARGKRPDRRENPVEQYFRRAGAVLVRCTAAAAPRRTRRPPR